MKYSRESYNSYSLLHQIKLFNKYFSKAFNIINYEILTRK